MVQYSPSLVTMVSKDKDKDLAEEPILLQMTFGVYKPTQPTDLKTINSNMVFPENGWSIRKTESSFQEETAVM